MTPFRSLKMPLNKHLQDLLFRSADLYLPHRTSAEKVLCRIYLGIRSSTTSLALKLWCALSVLLVYVAATAALLRAISSIYFHHLYPIKLLQTLQFLSDDSLPENAQQSVHSPRKVLSSEVKPLDHYPCRPV